jgi:hypothetical protein
MEKELKELTDEELVEEVNNITNFMEYGAVGKSDMFYESACWREVERRGLELAKKVIYVLEETEAEEEED